MLESLRQKKILVVDDEENIRQILEAALSRHGAQVLLAPTAEAGLEIAREENLDLVISDIRMPGMDGIEFLKVLKEEQPWLQVLLITAHGSMDIVVRAMRLGAADFLTKPFDIRHLREVADGILARNAERAPSTRQGTSAAALPHGIIGQSKSFLAAVEICQKASRTDSNVLLLGESGTGKEVMARMVHDQSPRAQGPFIAVNCGAIPENLMESELFGYEKGAFTGALHEKPGKVELAAGGTLFLDEIGEMPLLLQVKLLRVLQQRTVERVGSLQARQVDFRLVAATNRDLQAEVAVGRFREDLFYRLNVIPVQLPPLRERGTDVVLLAQYFLSLLNTRYETRFALDETQQGRLLQYSWPGNIRELENILERSVVLASDSGFRIMLPEVREPSSPVVASVAGTTTMADALKEGREEAEREVIVKACESTRWNKTQAAKLLGISRRGLLYKIKAYGIG